LPPGKEDVLGQLFGAVLTTDAMAAATSDRSWLKAMLQFEEALAEVEADAGLVPSSVVGPIRQCCLHCDDFDTLALGRAGRLSGNPAVALVAELRRRLPDKAAQWVHFGATSQDVVDTAMMLILRSALDLVLADLSRAAGAAADLAGRYRSTPMVARTLLRHALPITFGRKAAGWLVPLLDATSALRHVRHHRLAVQLGGPSGTLPGLGPGGPQLAERLAARLGLAAPVVPWHTDRTRVVEAAGALTVAAGIAGKIALDVALMMQDEVGEATEPTRPGRGGSSSMPHKRNPAMSVAVGAAWRRAQGLYAVLLGAMAQEHERAAGAWQAEAETLSELCRVGGGAVSVTADILAGLEVNEERMAMNLELVKQAEDSAEGSRTASAEQFVDRALAFYRAGNWEGRGHD
jgi:3-carboxy-cis,cis-muconate cycloisomerase